MIARPRSLAAAAFTLIELLVVVLVIGILVAVAAPSFLGQTQKAQDSEAKQYLSIAYQAAKAATVTETNQGDYPSAALLTSAIVAAEPGFTAAIGDQGQNEDPTRILVDASGSDATTAARLVLHNQSASGQFCTLDAPQGAPLNIYCDSTGVPAPVLVSGSGPLVIGSAQEGQTLTASVGTWDDATSYTYQWQSSSSPWVDIAGATASSYLLQNADIGKIVRVCVTGHGVGGDSAPACSAATSSVTSLPPANTGLPLVTGTTNVDQTLATTTGTWSNNPTSYDYQWLRCTDDVATGSCVNIAGATASTYQSSAADLGQYLRAVVTAMNSGAPAGVAATSNPTADIRAALTETPVTLTTSGGLITDASRSSAVQGDGRLNDSSFGVWTATTNLIDNGGYETTVATIRNQARFAGNIARSSAYGAKFGTYACSMTTTAAGDATADTTLVNSQFVPTVAGQTYTVSIWTWMAASYGARSFRYRLLWYDAANVQVGGTVTGPNYPLGAGVANAIRPTITATAPATSTKLRIVFDYAQPTAAGETYLIDGLQLEQQPLATPYMHTDGATASRVAGRVQAPVTTLNTTQGWVALRARTGFATAAPPSGATTMVFSWAANGINYLALDYYNGSWRALRQAPGGGIQSSAQTLSLGQTTTVIMAWDSTKVYLSINGGAFASTTNTAIPAISTTTFDLGGGGTTWPGREADSDILWSAAGTGTLTNSQASQLAGYSEPPNLGLMPGTATFRWLADNATAYVR